MGEFSNLSDEELDAEIAELQGIVTEVQNELNPPESASLGDLALTAATSIPVGLAEFGAKGVTGLARAGVDYLGEAADYLNFDEFADRADSASTKLGTLQEAFSQQGQETRGQIREGLDIPDTTATQITDEIASSVGPSVLAMTPGGWPLLAGGIAGGEYGDARAEGSSIAQASVEAPVDAVLMTLLETYGARKFLGVAKAGGWGQKAKNFMKAAGIEGATEAAEELGGGLLETQTRPEDKAPTWQDIVATTTKAGLYGTAAAVALGPIGAAFKKFNPDIKAANKATQDNEARLKSEAEQALESADELDLEDVTEFEEIPGDPLLRFRLPEEAPPQVPPEFRAERAGVPPDPNFELIPSNRLALPPPAQPLSAPPPQVPEQFRTEYPTGRPEPNFTLRDSPQLGLPAPKPPPVTREVNFSDDLYLQPGDINPSYITHMEDVISADASADMSQQDLFDINKTTAQQKFPEPMSKKLKKKDKVTQVSSGEYNAVPSLKDRLGSERGAINIGDLQKNLYNYLEADPFSKTDDYKNGKHLEALLGHNNFIGKMRQNIMMYSTMAAKSKVFQPMWQMHKDKELEEAHMSAKGYQILEPVLKLAKEEEPLFHKILISARRKKAKNPEFVLTDNAMRKNGASEEQIHAVRAMHNAMDGMLEDIRQAYLSSIKENFKPNSDKAVLMEERVNEAFDTMAGKYYVPFTRMGKYRIGVTGPDGTKELETWFETKKEWKAKEAELLEQYKEEDGYLVDSGKAFKRTKSQVNLYDPANDLKELKIGGSSRGFMQHMMPTDFVPGFNQDITQNAMAYMLQAPKFAGNVKYRGRMRNMHDNVPKNLGTTQDMAHRLFNESLTGDGSGASPVSNWLTFKYLANFHSPLHNLIGGQQLLLADVYSQTNNLKDTKRTLGETYKLARQYKKSPDKMKDQALRRALDKEREFGVTSPQVVRHFVTRAKGKQPSKIRKVMDFGLKPFSFVEADINRSSAYIANYLIAKEQGISDPRAHATEGVSRSQFDYTMANAPELYKHMNRAVPGLGTTSMLFQRYGGMQLRFIRNMMAEKKFKQSAALFGAMTTMGGIKSLPFMLPAGVLLGLLGEELAGVDLQDELEFLTDSNGTAKFVREWLQDGLPQAARLVNLSGGLSGMQLMQPGKTAEHQALSFVFGPALEEIYSLIEVKRRIKKLGWDAAPEAVLEKLGPSAAKDVFRAYKMAKRRIGSFNAKKPRDKAEVLNAEGEVLADYGDGDTGLFYRDLALTFMGLRSPFIHDSANQFYRFKKKSLRTKDSRTAEIIRLRRLNKYEKADDIMIQSWAEAEKEFPKAMAMAHQEGMLVDPETIFMSLLKFDSKQIFAEGRWNDNDMYRIMRRANPVARIEMFKFLNRLIDDTKRREALRLQNMKQAADLTGVKLPK